MNITEEQLLTIYNRAIQYAITKYGSEPDRLELEYNGQIKAVWETYRCGDWDIESEYISPESLNEDLDDVARKRKIEEEERRKAEEERRKAEEIIREARQKEIRRQEYLKLKNEFEGIK